MYDSTAIQLRRPGATTNFSCPTAVAAPPPKDNLFQQRCFCSALPPSSEPAAVVSCCFPTVAASLMRELLRATANALAAPASRLRGDAVARARLVYCRLD
ncbi:hypothetical protein BHE74_00057010 [Ensete ventricosum]|nr:hypothetical protein BHE74_00057010 [Ensete ventricosum]RZS11760.1 hypothetical protein BHM03_00043134 [Ensete ventricosum]